MSVLCRVVWVGLLLLSLTVIDQAAVSGQLLRRGCQPRCRTPLLQRLQVRQCGLRERVTIRSCQSCTCSCSPCGNCYAPPGSFCLRDKISTGGGYASYEATTCDQCNDLYTFHGVTTLIYAAHACCTTHTWPTGPCYYAPPFAESTGDRVVVVPQDREALGSNHKYRKSIVGNGLVLPLNENRIKVRGETRAVQSSYCKIEHLDKMRLVKLFWITSPGKPPVGVGYEIKRDDEPELVDVTYIPSEEGDNVGIVEFEVNGPDAPVQNYFVILAQ